MTAPWQLYTFCVVHIVASLFMYGFIYDPCQLITGKSSACKPGAETYAARAMAIGFLYVGLFFLVLTYLNKENVPKLKRLANMAMNCVVALFIGVMFTGSKSLGGVENSLMHTLDMFSIFLLLIIMISALMGDSPMVGSNALRDGLGINPKGFVLLVAIATLVKLFVLNDFVDPSSFLADPDSSTKLSWVMWSWLSVCLFDIILALAFAIAFGNAQDQEGLTIATVVMMIVSLVSIIPISDSLKDGMMRQAYISIGVGVALAIVAVVGGRRSGSQQGYETVSNVV